MWQALVDGDAQADARLLSDDFLGVYPTGFADRSDHAGQLLDGPTVTAFSINDARLLIVSENAVMLSYRADWQRPPVSGKSDTAFISSLWCRRDGEWLNVFSQDTPTI